MRFLVVFLGAAALIVIGIRSYLRIARRARADGALLDEHADTNRNAGRIYLYAFKHPSLDTVLMLIGFVGGLTWIVVGPMVLPW
jgi:hypothetical protein